MPDRIERADDPAILLQDGHLILSVEFLDFDSLPLDRDQIPGVRKTFVFGVGNL